MNWKVPTRDNCTQSYYKPINSPLNMETRGQVSRREILSSSASAMVALAGCGGQGGDEPTSTTQSAPTTTTPTTTDEPSENTSTSNSTTATPQQTTKGYAGEPVIENVSGYVSAEGTVDRLNITISRPPKAKAFNLFAGSCLKPSSLNVTVLRGRSSPCLR